MPTDADAPLPDITFDQVATLVILRARYPTGLRWHKNECGCCLAVHTPDGDYIVGEDGDFDFYPVEQ